MERYVDLPSGPSGRSPQAGIQMENPDLDQFLVLFTDGSIGIWEDQTTARPWSRSSLPQFDGSEYNMICYSMGDLAKIEGDQSSTRKNSILLLSWVALTSAFLTLYIINRSDSQWLWETLDFGEYRTLIAALPLFFYWLQRRLFVISNGDVILYHLNSDPYRLPIRSIYSNTIAGFCIISLLLALGSLAQFSGTWAYYDGVIATLLIWTMIGYLAERPAEELIAERIFQNRKNKLSTEIFPIDGFIRQTNLLRSEINRKHRNENPLLALLMANESTTLEFKSSLWAKYNNATGEVVGKEKMMELQDEVVKTVAAFLNTKGGTLLIGVKDKPRTAGDDVAEVRGIEPDFKWLGKRKDTEGYTHSLQQIFQHAYDSPIAISNIDISYPEFENKIVCRIDVDPLPRKIGMECRASTKTETEFGKKELLFIRSDDTTLNMSPKSQYGYLRHHFEGYPLEENSK